MEEKRKTIVIIIILITIFIILPIVGVGIFFLMTEEPGVEVQNIEFKSIDPATQSIIFLVTVDVDNPNSISATLVSIHTSVYIENEFAGTVIQNVNKKIDAKDNTTLKLDFVLSDVPTIQSEVVEVRIDGHATVKVFLLPFNIPIDESKEVNLSDAANQPPTAVIIHDAPVAVRTGREVSLDGTRSRDPDGEISLYEWDFGDGSPVETGPSVTHIYMSRGQYTVTLVVHDNWGASGTDNSVIRVIGIG